jgi:hypothetical protein
MNRISPHLSYANVAATLALFLALGGISWAAVALPRNSVGAKQIRTSAVGSAEVKDGAISGRDFAPDTLLQGPQGPKGDKGDAGQSGVQNVIVRLSSAATLPARGGGGEPGLVSAIADCDPGERAVGGGGQTTNDGDATGSVDVVASKPQPQSAGATPTGWATRGANYSTTATELFTWAVCVS